LWSNGANWAGTAPPSNAATDLIFAGTTNTGTSANPLNQNIATPFILNSITFSSGGGAFFLGGGQLQFNQNATGIVQSSSSSESVANAINLGSKEDLKLSGVGTGVVTLSGNITESSGSGSNAATVIKSGTSTFVLSGANTYSGGTSVGGATNGGTLLVSNTTGSGTGTGNVTVNGSGTTLGGTGSISGTVTLGNTTAGAVINPGPQGANGTSASVGTLTVGALTLTGSDTFHADAFGTAANQFDKLAVNTSATLGTTSQFQLSIASGLTFTPGADYKIIDANAISGTFAGIADNSLQTFSGYQFIAHYNLGGDGDFELVAVPEPSTWFAAGLSLLAVAYSQRRRFIKTLRS